MQKNQLGVGSGCPWGARQWEYGEGKGLLGISGTLCCFVCLFTRTCHFDKKYVASEIWERLAFYLVTASVWVKGDQERQ